MLHFGIALNLQVPSVAIDPAPVMDPMPAMFFSDSIKLNMFLYDLEKKTVLSLKICCLTASPF